MKWLARSLFILLSVALASCSAIRREHARLSGIDQAAQAWEGMSEGGDSPALMQLYRDGVAQVLAEMAGRSAPEKWPATMKLENGWTIRVDQGSATSHDVWTPKLFNELEAPEKKPESPVPGALREGIGLPVDGVRTDDHLDEQSRYVWQGKQDLPVTAVLEFSGDASRARLATLRLYDPREVQSVKVGTRNVTLAADFVTPVHKVLDRRSFVRRALGGLLRPGRFLDDEGLFIQEPYRADKVPIVLVHGLMSDPHIWENIVVALMSDPQIGKRVQCWCFMYPSGLPVPVSAARLRGSLTTAEKIFDPDNNDPGMSKTMLIGHSMGGLLSRMQIIDSDLAFWHTWFTAPPEKVPLDGPVSQMMRGSLLFKSNPDVKRVLYIATPHRGSELADGWIGRMGASLIRAPLTLVQIATSVATLDVEQLNPARLEMKFMGANSISGLSTKHPVLQALAARPMKAPCDSIIAVVREKPKLEDTSDGVVPYHSSHLDEAKSETTVKSGHSCTKKIETVDAAREVVRKHLFSRG